MKNILKKKLFLVLLGVFGLFGILAVLMGGWYLNGFSKGAGMAKKEIVSQAIAGFKNSYKNDYLTFLILGLDERADERTLLTDTMILITVDAKSGNYFLVSIPRDLWLDDLQTKINALYFYGKEKNPNDGVELVKTKVQEIFGAEINYTFLLKMDEIKDLVDLLGGVEIDIERSFVDEEYPLDDGSYQVKTIKFEAGRQILTGERALEFIRSRKSKDEIEGTDEARQKRQRKIIFALKERILNPRFFLDSRKLGEIYKFIVEETEIKPELKFADLASFSKLGLKVLKGKQTEIEISDKGGEAVLEAINEPRRGGWILRPKNDDWSLLRDYFKSKIER